MEETRNEELVEVEETVEDELADNVEDYTFEQTEPQPSTAFVAVVAGAVVAGITGAAIIVNKLVKKRKAKAETVELEGEVEDDEADVVIEDEETDESSSEETGEATK